MHLAWVNSVVENLGRFGDEGYTAAKYIRSNRTKISIKRNKSSLGAWWTIDRKIHLNSEYFTYENSLANERLYLLVIHEVRHLQQGFFTALSVYGELDAWQLEWRIHHRIHSEYPHAAIEELMNLPLGWDRNVLRKAAKLMQAYATKEYRVDLLPLYPVGKEIRFWLTKRIPESK